MSTRRRIGVSVATTEAARRQLMQPVPCWEKVWALPDNAPPGSTVKIYKWAKTEKKQAFSDDEGEVDQPLAPLPDEPEVVEGDEEIDQDEVAPSVEPEAASRDASEPVMFKDDLESPSKLVSPKPHPLSISLLPPTPTPIDDVDDVNDGLDAALKPLDPNIDIMTPLDGEIPPDLDAGDIIDMDLSQLGPDGTPFESAHNLDQLETTDPLMGGEAMDESVDPFGPPSI